VPVVAASRKAPPHLPVHPTSVSNASYKSNFGMVEAADAVLSFTFVIREFTFEIIEFDVLTFDFNNLIIEITFAVSHFARAINGMTFAVCHFADVVTESDSFAREVAFAGNELGNRT
jgi:hypothetical protein